MEIISDDLKYNLINLKQIVFEVTDSCNLRCKYCAYANLYKGYDKRENIKFPYQNAVKIIDYLYNFWKENVCIGNSSPLTIGFYGGEPLLNILFIKQVIAYTKSLPPIGKKFFYNMTSNAILLDKYMDFLVENKFQLLISLDGDKEGQSYRVDASGKNSFDRVFANVQLLKDKYPTYFEHYVNFNSVLHNRNNVEQIYKFIKKHFDKEPSISTLNTSGIRKEKIKEFNETYQNVTDSIAQASNCEALINEMFIKSPQTASLLDDIHYRSGNVFDNYNEIFINKKYVPVYPTGTCIPFLKKMFVTVKGKILQCERINHEFALGQITDSGVELDLEQVALKHNKYVSTYQKQCSVCALNSNCIQCVYQINDIHETTTKCPSFCSQASFDKYIENSMEHLDKHPELYNRILKETVIRI